VDGCGAGGGAGAQELGVRGVGSIARGEWRGSGAAGLEGDAPDATRGGGSSRPSAAGEAGAVSKRRRGRFEKVRAG
jgi:hypothetical protein